MTEADANTGILRRRSGRPLVVVVDDEPGILSALARLLRHEACEVRTTSSPWEVFEWVRERDVDVVVSDHAMPQMPGVELLSRVSELSPATAGVMLTAHRGRADLHPGARRCARHIVDKPWDENELRGLIRELLRDRAGNGGPA